MTSSMILFALLLQGSPSPLVDQWQLIILTLVLTGLLCLLNISLAVFYRNRRLLEVVSYYVVCGIELVIWVFALLLQLHVVTRVPFPLPPGLPINRAMIGAALAFGIGLSPVAYWHRINVSELPKRLAKDAEVMKARSGGGVRIRSNTPGEWMN
ncbi:MAG TPA: hypothetical protein VL485_20650 [Ktedonobacteraceae bacterium]|nr:hypothetical protein [Ktedonobacteraceae bacterium]